MMHPIKETMANSVDPDQRPHSAVSDQSLHCLPYLISFNSKNNYGNFYITPICIYNAPLPSSKWKSLLKIFGHKWVKLHAKL